MPTNADTPTPVRARFAPIVLITALGVAFGGLTLTDAVPTAQETPVVLARELREGPGLVHATVVATKAAPVRRTVRRATRKRVALERWVRPSSAGVVSPYGMRWGRMHEGIDFGAGYGAPIRAAGNGVVLGAGYLPGESGYGKIVLIRHPRGVVTAYAHMSRTLVRAGERVTAGEVIGRVGNTGHSRGAHLHFEVRIGGAHLDPRTWLRRHGVHV